MTEPEIEQAVAAKLKACGMFWEGLRNFLIEAPPVPEEIFLKLAQSLGIEEPRAHELRNNTAQLIKPWTELTRDQQLAFTETDEMDEVGRLLMRSVRRATHPESFDAELEDVLDVAARVVSGKAHVIAIDVTDILSRG